MVTPPSREPVGRREANKAATRTAIRDAARRLFAEHGFERTSVREIATAAGVTERTFYRYFEGKEGLLIEEVADWMGHFADVVRAQPAMEPPLDAVLGAVRSVLRAPGARGVSAFLRVLETERPFRSLARPSIRPLRQLEDVIAAALADRAAGNGQRDDAQVTFEDEVASRMVVAAIRSATISHRRMLAATGNSPGFEALLVAAFAVSGELAGHGTSPTRRSG